MAPRSTELLYRVPAAKTAIAACAKSARDNPALFAQFVMRDEQTGGAIRLTKMHREWHELITKHDAVVLWAAVESGKSQEISIARVLYEVTRQRGARWAIVSNTHEQAVKIVRTIARYIEQSEALHQVWPDLETAEPWSPDGGRITIARQVLAKDPTVQAFGVRSGSVLGTRLDGVVLDDVLDWENTRTPQARQALWEWLHATLHGRLVARAKFVVVGTAFHPDDMMHRYAREFGPERARRYPVLDEHGEPRWPERWSKERIEAKRISLGPLEFARQMLCVARDDSSSRFKREWVDRALVRGRGKRLCHALSAVPPGCRVITGVDLAVQQHAAADLTVLTTIVVHPNEDRELVGLEAGRWAGPEIVSRIVETHRRYMSKVVVENNASQDFILQFTRDMSAVPVVGFTTGRNKANPEFGVESLATELANGKWIFPCSETGVPEPEVQALVDELLFYDPRTHTGDRLMSLWFAREGARMIEPVAEVGRVDLFRR